MEFLKKIFNDELNLDGVVSIIGSDFERHSILQKMEEETYNLAFQDWKILRKQQMLDKADELLSKYNNNARFLTLKNIYKQGNVIPFIGAGMSILSGYSGWTSFLYKLREETYISEDELNALISNGEYEEAAQKLFDNMPQNAFNEEIENEYANCKDIFGCVQYLPHIFKEKVITTNFDCVLERCYENADKAFKKVMIGKDTEDIAKIMTVQNSLLVKLHGEADSATKRVLTKNEYNNFYTASNTLKLCIETITYNSLLFLGCSLSTDRTIKTMIEIADNKGHNNIPRHYVFLALNSEDDRVARKNELAKANIFPIWYDANEDHDECIEALLIKLAD